MTFLTLTNVRKEFGATVAVNTFNLDIEKGEFVAFLGPSGCGKTTVLRMVAGFEQPTSGTIMLENRDITRIPTNKRNIGMVFQQYALFPNMTVHDNICFGLKVAGKDKRTMDLRAREMLNLIGMRDFGGRYPSQLSGGQQQRVALARALALSPQLLLLDEPLSALDAKIRLSLREEIRAIQRRLGITTIFVTHDQEEAMSIADRIVVMNRGLVEQVGQPQEIYNSPATQFVASFIGTLNVVKAEIADGQNRCVRFGGQEIVTEDALDTAERSVTVALRPEAITLNGTNGYANKLNATVEDVYFLGSVVRVRTRLGDEHLNVDTFNSPGLKLPVPGEAVTLCFPAEAARVLRSSAAS